MDPAPQHPDRNLAMELARATEAAALAAGRWFGRGDKNGADGAAVDAMRLVLNSVPMEGVVVIGEGEKDEAPMLFNGEEIGDGRGPAVDIAVDPIDGTTLTSRGQNNAISVIAVAERGTMFDPGPCVYMDKIAVGAEAADVVGLDAPIKANLEAVAKAKGEKVHDVTAVILDRPRHEQIIQECREAGARIRLITDGDIAGAISVSTPGSGSDILFGVEGPPRASRPPARCSAPAAPSSDGSGPATRAKARPRSMRATTSTASSPPPTSSRARRCSSPPPASPTATS